MSIHKDDIIMLDIYTYNKRTLNHMKQKLTEPHREIDAKIMVVRDFNTLPSIIRTSRKKICKDIENLNIINQTGTTNIYRGPTTEYRFLSHACIIFYQGRSYTRL